MTAMPGKCMEMLLLTAVSPFTASRMWSRHTVARSHFCFGCLHASECNPVGAQPGTLSPSQSDHAAGRCMWMAACSGTVSTCRRAGGAARKRL